MDSDSSLGNEEYHNGMMFSDSRRKSHGRKTMLVVYALLVVSYILILALFMMVFFKPIRESSVSSGFSKLSGVKTNDTTQLETINEFNRLTNKVSELSSKLNLLGKYTKNISGTSFFDRIDDFNDLRNNVSELASKVSLLEISLKQVCDNEWIPFDDSCYYFNPRKGNWKKARSICKEKQSDLVVITTAEEHNFLISKFFYASTWIGLSDLDDEGAWKWVDGTNYITSYKNWNEGEPNDSGSNEDCAHIGQTTGLWNDLHCTEETMNAICEKKIVS